MRIVVAPDSFKGSLTSSEAAAAIAHGIRQVIGDADVIEFPIADGGEGTLAMIASHERVAIEYLTVPGADDAQIRAPYCVIELDGRTCVVIESAAIVGLAQARSRAILDRSTRGIGRLIAQLLEQDIRSFVLALGGSATNDGGAGTLAELGVGLFDAELRSVEPTPRGLLRLQHVSFAALNARIAEAKLLALADVDNPLAGPHGASRTFGPQKGLQGADIERVDAALAHFGELCAAARGHDWSQQAGSGAAGGLGFAIRVLGGDIAPGAAWLARRYQLAEQIANADWVITGEGRSDAQTLRGKAPLCVAQLARQARVPVSLISGTVDTSAWPQLGALFSDYMALASAAGDTAAMREAAQRLQRAAAAWARLRAR